MHGKNGRESRDTVEQAVKCEREEYEVDGHCPIFTFRNYYEILIVIRTGSKLQIHYFVKNILRYNVL